MSGMVIVEAIVQWLAERAPNAFHYSEIANNMKLELTSVGNALNNRVNGKDPDIERVRKGVWRYVGPGAPTSDPGANGGVAPTGMPSLLEFIGVNKDETMLYRDPDTMKLYRVEAN